MVKVGVASLDKMQLTNGVKPHKTNWWSQPVVMAMWYFAVVHTCLFCTWSCISPPQAVSCPEVSDLLPAVIALSVALVVVILLLAAAIITIILLYTSESSHIERC